MHRRLEPLIWPLLIATLALLAIPHFAHGEDLPDPALTPGACRTDMTVAQMCKIKWGKDHRAVTAAMKKQVFAAYGYPKGNKDKRCPCEIDHLCSRELLGMDVVINLWVQSYRGPWNAHLKDKLENRLHKEVCAGNLDLGEAQQMLMTDWTSAYRKYFGKQK